MLGDFQQSGINWPLLCVRTDEVRKKSLTNKPEDELLILSAGCEGYDTGVYLCVW